MKFKLFVSIVLSFTVLGCASTGGFPYRPEDIESKISSLQSKFFLPAVDVLQAYSIKSPGTQRMDYRNSVVHGRLLALDMQFALFKESIYREGVASNLSLDFLGVAVGATGAVTTSADASRILSALSGGISGTKTAVNKNLYYENTMPALLALMDARRTEIRAEILEGLAQSDSTYSLGQALTDLERYLQAGSIPGAIASITSAAGKKKSEAETELKQIRDKSFVDLAAQRRVSKALDYVNQLPVEGAWNILKAPPSSIDQYTLAAVKARLGGTDLSNASALLSGAGNDTNAKNVLKMILVLIADNSQSNFAKWNAAIRSQQ